MQSGHSDVLMSIDEFFIGFNLKFNVAYTRVKIPSPSRFAHPDRFCWNNENIFGKRQNNPVLPGMKCTIWQYCLRHFTDPFNAAMRFRVKNLGQRKIRKNMWIFEDSLIKIGHHANVSAEIKIPENWKNQYFLTFFKNCQLGCFVVASKIKLII